MRQTFTLLAFIVIVMLVVHFRMVTQHNERDADYMDGQLIANAPASDDDADASGGSDARRADTPRPTAVGIVADVKD